MTLEAEAQISDKREFKGSSKNIGKSIISGKKRPVARTNISVDKAVFEEFSVQTKRQNKTLFALANESLSAIAKISADGGDPSELHRLWGSLSLLRQFDVIILPSDIVDELIERQYALDKENLLKIFRDLGGRLVGILKIDAADLDSLAELARDFAALLPLKHFKITKLEESDTVEIGIVGAGRRIESTECTLEFLRSLLSGYGYTVAKHEMNVGSIRLWASREAPPNPVP